MDEEDKAGIADDGGNDVFDEMAKEDFGEDSLPDGKEEDQEVAEEPGTATKPDPMTEVMTKLTALEAKNTELEKAARRAFYNERHEKKAAKVEGKEEAVLTDAEIKAIIKDNADDPEVLFNALTYKAQQIAKQTQKSAVDEVELKQKGGELTAILKQRVPDYDSPDSSSAETIAKSKSYFNLDDHPYGEFLGAAAAVYADLPNISKQWFEAGKKAAMDESADANRKAEIKSGQITPGGKKDNGGTPGKSQGAELSASQMDAFNRIFGHISDPKARQQKLALYKTQIAGQNRKAA